VIWIAWRFQRSVACSLALVALFIIGFAVVTGVMQHDDLMQFLGAPCHGSEVATPGRGDLCGVLAVKLANAASYDSEIRATGYIIAPLVGAILGLVALVNELDHRTVRLAWTQSISRGRWFAAKVGVGAAVVTLILVPTAIALSWWNGEVRGYNLFGRDTYGVAGWDLVAYGLFAFALATLLGAVIRRVGWTLAATTILFLSVAFVVPTQVRAHLVTPSVQWSSPFATVHKGSAATQPQGYPYNAWILVSGAVPRTIRKTPTWNDVSATNQIAFRCISGYPGKTLAEQSKAETECYKKLDIENVAVFIADNQFWTLQLREGLLYLVAGAALIGGAFALVRRIEP
jgi:hypothetical protein